MHVIYFTVKLTRDVSVNEKLEGTH